MPHVLKARDGRNHTVSDKEDVFRLVTEYLGSDFSDWLEDWAEDYKAEVQDEMDETREIAKEAEAELDQLKNHQRQVFTDVGQSEAIWGCWTTTSSRMPMPSPRRRFRNASGPSFQLSS